MFISVITVLLPPFALVKMVKKCCVYTCASESYGGCNISFHSLPADEGLRRRWLSGVFVRQRITKYSVVCSRHFEPSCFYTTPSRRHLRTDAVPTIPAKKKRRLAKAAMQRREKIANESFIEKQKRLESRRAARAEKLLNEPLEDRFFRQYIDKIRAQDRRSSETPEQRAARIEKIRVLAQLRKGKCVVCALCRKRFYPHEVTKYNETTSDTVILRELKHIKGEFALCNHCNEYYPPSSSGPDQPSCSSITDSDPLPMEEQLLESEPQTLMEIKQEVLWEERSRSGGEDEPRGADRDSPAPDHSTEEDDVIKTLENISEEISTLARENTLSAGLEKIREEISELARGDSFDAFGRYVASLLRNMQPRRAEQAQPLIINLLAAEMIRKDDAET